MSNLDKITEKIMKFAQLRYIKIIMNAFMSVAAFSIGASLFSLLRSIPIPFWQTFLTNTGLTDILNIPITMVSNLYAIMIVICVGYEVAQSFGAKPLPAAMIAFGSFMILTPFNANVAIQNGEEVVRGVAQNVIGLGPLGSQGIFLAMFTGLIAARLYVFLIQKNIKLKMPASLPPAVAGMFETMIPAGLVFIVFIVIRLLFQATPFGTAQAFIYGVLQAPLVGIGATPVGAALYLMAGKFLWMFGIHGDLLAYAALGSVRSAATQANMAAFAAGEAVPYLEWTLLTPFTNVHILSLTILLLLSKSEQFKSLGKLSIATSAFNITEPIMFGLPIILNPIMAVPFVLLPGLNVFLTSLLMRGGIIASSTGAALSSNIPTPIYMWMTTNSLSGLIWGLIVIALDAVVFYPFFKIAEKQALKQEAEQAAE
ncbi:MAG: PTS sugar transporter subunit IIC [Erysipelotrichaceae bacterium]|nr:PTS sugar transporter subunit IIC [Erysipelotrichaceae bacterium]MBQ1378776.1 PTS sugar transporter subunit IIC [Erysipelotrichaceae bacterium]MBQ1911388.1 PTS sugar transporter subunit IIC [Erysipelotrichaceae bacterium]MBQ2078164.1 PTS sugar transporter subunit IIC [Erysipelotrichaceae bacterium]MBQ2233398.1 PTS sugar transporter subunit IIC [Erysipelotrichaceae bacterium]